MKCPSCKKDFQLDNPTKKFSKHHNREIFIHRNICPHCGRGFLNGGCIFSESGEHIFEKGTKDDGGILVKWQKCECGLYFQCPLKNLAENA